MFALDLSAKCCYQSHRLSQGIPICSKWKSSEREKHKRIKKAKFKCNRNVTLPLVSDIECLYHQLSFPSPSSWKAFKSPSFIPPWYRTLLKSLGKKAQRGEQLLYATLEGAGWNTASARTAALALPIFPRWVAVGA